MEHDVRFRCFFLEHFCIVQGAINKAYIRVRSLKALCSLLISDKARCRCRPFRMDLEEKGQEITANVSGLWVYQSGVMGPQARMGNTLCLLQKS